MAGCAGHRAAHTVQFTRRVWDQTMALNLVRKMTYILRLLTIRLIFIEVQDHKQTVCTPLDRSSVALQQTTDTVDIDTFHVQILAIRQRTVVLCRGAAGLRL